MDPRALRAKGRRAQSLLATPRPVLGNIPCVRRFGGSEMWDVCGTGALVAAPGQMMVRSSWVWILERASGVGGDESGLIVLRPAFPSENSRGVSCARAITGRWCWRIECLGESGLCALSWAVPASSRRRASRCRRPNTCRFDVKEYCSLVGSLGLPHGMLAPAKVLIRCDGVCRMMVRCRIF